MFNPLYKGTVYFYQPSYNAYPEKIICNIGVDIDCLDRKRWIAEPIDEFFRFGRNRLYHVNISQNPMPDYRISMYPSKAEYITIWTKRTNSNRIELYIAKQFSDALEALRILHAP